MKNEEPYDSDRYLAMSEQYEKSALYYSANSAEINGYSYFAKVIQGDQQKFVKIIKVNKK